MSFESKIVYMDKDLFLIILSLCTSLLRILYKECKHTLDSTHSVVALDSYCSNISLTRMTRHVCCLVYHCSGLGDVLQPPLQLQL